MATRALKRATAHQVFRELMEDEFSVARKPDMKRKERRESAWAKAKLIAKSMIKYTEEKEAQRQGTGSAGKASATLVKENKQEATPDATN